MSSGPRNVSPPVRRRTLLGLAGAVAASSVPLVGDPPVSAGAAGAAAQDAVPVQSLDGSGNNRQHPQWGMAGRPYVRVAPSRYADGVGEPVAGPNPRYVSNRVFSDAGQSLFSERRVSRWAFVFGQFLDHSFGLAEGRGANLVPDPGGPPDEPLNIPVDGADPLEDVPQATFVPFSRATAAPGTGVTSPRQQVNLGMLAEPHLPGCELGELQLASWTRQFRTLRDGDRFFYGNDPGLSQIRRWYGIDFKNNLGDLIALNTDIPRDALPESVFFVRGGQ